MGRDDSGRSEQRGRTGYAAAMLKTILVGYDGTRPAERALSRAGELARAFGARVLVVSVAAPEPVTSTGGAFGLLPYYDPTAEPNSQADEKIWKLHRDRVEAFFSGLGVPVEFAGLSGPAVEEIVDAAQEHEADLIVVGTRDPGFLERLVGGSVSQGVARRARCDVLIVHTPEQ
jgi:nucleotide-binding universal stress UspA family protein